ncbi:MAG: hypothetical protein K2N30_00020, partial [Clostridia bacterium]|nr:hypothetical protein [Clostridia bacterium]
AIAQKVAEIDGGAINCYECGYGGYIEQKRKSEEDAQAGLIEEKAAAYKAEKDAFYRSKKDRAEEAKRKQLVKRTEEKIGELEGEEAALNAKLASGITDYKEIEDISNRMQDIKNELDALYKEYETMI